jgi:hypothetical protein
MKILYLTDERSDYPQGHYYQDWIDVFDEDNEVTFWGPGYPTNIDQKQLKKYDLLIFGHAVYRILCSTGYPFVKRKWWSRKRWWVSHYWQIDFRKVPIPKILFTQNEYGIGLQHRVIFCNNEGIDLIITYCRAAKEFYQAANLKVEWVPFGVNPGLFKNLNLTRTIDIGYRGNLHLKWLGDIRQKFLQEIQKQCPNLRLDLLPGEADENMLTGESYVQWMNQCHLAANTASAQGIVNAKFWEQFACGCVPVAIEDEYEGLLQADIDYLSISPDFSNLQTQIDRFFTDETFRQKLLDAAQARATEASMQNRYQQVIEIFQNHALI